MLHFVKHTLMIINCDVRCRYSGVPRHGVEISTFFQQVFRRIKLHYFPSIEHHHPVVCQKEIVSRLLFIMLSIAHDMLFFITVIVFLIPPSPNPSLPPSLLPPPSSPPPPSVPPRPSLPVPGAVHDALQAVCDGEDGAVGELPADRGLDQVVQLQVHGSRGLVQDQDAGLAEQGPAQTQQLPLAHAGGGAGGGGGRGAQAGRYEVGW